MFGGSAYRWSVSLCLLHLTLFALLGSGIASAQRSKEPDWAAAEAEALKHFQNLVRMDTSDPPGGEKPAADYLQQVLLHEGIPVQVFALDPNRPNVVARLKGSGAKRPLLIMGHTDVVPANPAGWRRDPFGAELVDGIVWGRGATDMLNLTATMAVATRRLAVAGFRLEAEEVIA